MIYEVEEVNNIVILKFKNEFSMRNVIEIEETWNDYILKNPTIILFDFMQLKFIDSSAIGTLVKFYNQAKKRHIDMKISDMSDSVKNVFTTAKLAQVFEIIDGDDFRDKYIED